MRRSAIVLLALALAACSSEPPPQPQVVTPGLPDHLTLLPANFDDLPGWDDDKASAVLPALIRSCDRLMKLPFDRSIGQEGVGGTVNDWYTPCAAVRRLPPGDDSNARLFFESWFQPYLVTNNGIADGTFTGYFEPELAGSRTRSAKYSVPILARPKDLVIRDGADGQPQVGRMVGGKLEPYPARADIENGTLGNLAQPLAWVADPVDAHILHIQGSGRIRLEDGSILRLGVAATNGLKFVGIGRIMRDRNLISDISMPAIRTWLKANPKEARQIMQQNPRYVFYRIVDGDGPLGSEGVALTPERSMAVDTRYIPLGVPLFLDTVDPSNRPLRRLVMAQDTGAAIKGVVRGDFFWGPGEAAFDKAGRMKSPGRYWMILPRQRSPRIALAE